MKKIMLSMVAIVFATSLQAQLYVKAGVGVAMPAASEVVGYKITATESEVVKGSLGKGIAPVVGVGFMLTKHIGVELSAAYLLGGKVKSTDATSSETMETSAKGISILPSIVLKGGNEDSKLIPYARLGLSVSPGMKVKTTDKYTTQTSVVVEETTEYKSKLGVGFTGALGLSFQINKMAAFWVEANGNMASAWLKSGEVTALKVGGVDQLSTLTGTNKSWTYEDKTTLTSTTRLSTSVPMSAVGVAVGLSFTLGNK